MENLQLTRIRIYLLLFHWDALGGEMAKAADRCCIQYRMLNRGKGPAVHSLRAQADRRKYQEDMKHTLERQERLELMQAMVTEIGLDERGAVCSVTTSLGAVYRVRAVVIASGTYLDSRVIIGDSAVSSGPDGMQAAVGLTDCLRQMGLRLRRFKTGTPPRVVNRRSIDFPAWSFSRATSIRRPSPSAPGPRRKTAPSAI